MKPTISPPSAQPDAKSSIATANIVFGTPWYTSHVDQAVVDVNIAAAELEVVARRELCRRETWPVHVAKATVAFATMRSLCAVVGCHQEFDIEAQSGCNRNDENEKKTGLPQVHIALGYKYSKSAACLWLTLAVLASVFFGVSFGLAWKDLGVGLEFGTGMLAFLTSIHKIISSAVRLGEESGQS